MAADETTRTEPSDTSAQPSPHIRLRVDLVVEIADAEALTRSALDHVARDELMPDEERADAEEIISGDAGEALACLVDPFDLLRDLPGVELAHASWGSEEMDAEELDALSFLDGAGDLEDHDHDPDPELDPGHEIEPEPEREDEDEDGAHAAAASGPLANGAEDFAEPLGDDLEEGLSDGIQEELRGLDGVRR